MQCKEQRTDMLSRNLYIKSAAPGVISSEAESTLGALIQGLFQSLETDLDSKTKKKQSLALRY